MKRVAFGLCLLGMLALPAQARAELIQGSYNFTLGSVVVSLGEINWTPTNLVISGRDYGTYDVDAGALRTGVFAHADFSVTGAFGNNPATNPPTEPEFIMDMSANCPADPNCVPVGASGGITDFFIMGERPTWEFTETFLFEGNIPGTPFFFTQLGPSVSVTISISGFAFDTLTPTLLSNWTAIISAQYANWTIQQLIDCLQGTVSNIQCTTPGSLPDNTWSGTFIATDAAIPEPATLFTFGAGAALLAARRRRKAQK